MNGRKVQIGNRRWLTESGVPSLPDDVLTDFEDKGKTAVMVAADNRVLGVIAIADTIKAGSKDAVRINQRPGRRSVVVDGRSRTYSEGRC